MPARKNRPGKCSREQPAVKHTRLTRYLEDQERISPGKDHYVGWPDMDEAEDLVRRGYLRGGDATGCFYVTQAFKEMFYR